MQIVDCQLFEKIQLAFNHVRIPLKSELNFSKPLIINNLTKHNSLQTFSGGQRISAGERTAGQSMKEEKPRRRVGIGFCRYILPVYFAGIFFNLTASLYFHNLLIFNVLPKPPLRLGTLESTQSQPAFLQLIDYQTPSEKRNGYGVGNTVARGGKTATSGFTSGFTDKRLSERCRITKISASERIFKQFYITC